jgi:hypothetical protein
MNAPGELTTPSSQFWCLEVRKIFLCDQLRSFDPLCSSFSSPHMTLSHDLVLILYVISGFCILRFFTPLDFKFPDARNREMAHLD